MCSFNTSSRRSPCRLHGCLGCLGPTGLYNRHDWASHPERGLWLKLEKADNVTTWANCRSKNTTALWQYGDELKLSTQWLRTGCAIPFNMGLDCSPRSS